MPPPGPPPPAVRGPRFRTARTAHARARTAHALYRPRTYGRTHLQVEAARRRVLLRPAAHAVDALRVAGRAQRRDAHRLQVCVVGRRKREGGEGRGGATRCWCWGSGRTQQVPQGSVRAQLMMTHEPRCLLAQRGHAGAGGCASGTRWQCECRLARIPNNEVRVYGTASVASAPPLPTRTPPPHPRAPHLRLAAREERAAVRPRQQAAARRDGPDVGHAAAVGAHALVQHQPPHDAALDGLKAPWPARGGG